MEEIISEIFRKEFGDEFVVERAWQLSGGATRQTVAVDAIGADGQSLRTVIQLASAGDPLFGDSRRAELRVLVEARSVGVPIVPILAGGEMDGGSHYLISGFVEGETRGGRLIRSEEHAASRVLLPSQLSVALARTHAIPPGEDWLGLPRPKGPSALTEVARFEEQWRTSETNPHPVLELALRWLRHELPPSAPPRLVHGDFRVGNFLVGEEGLRAVLDWELCHWGDPLEDLGWLMVRVWRFGSDKQVGGLCSLEEFVELYGNAANVPVDRTALRWWEVFGNFRWAVLTIKQSQLHLSGQETSVELASLGRLTAETEWELLRLIGD